MHKMWTQRTLITNYKSTLCKKCLKCGKLVKQNVVKQKSKAIDNQLIKLKIIHQMMKVIIAAHKGGRDC